MKKPILLLLLLCSFFGIAQSINDYKYAIVPVKYEFQKKENQFRLNTLTKYQLTNIGFTVFYDTDVLSDELANNRCDKLYVNVERQNAFLSEKLIIIFKDCKNNIVFKSQPGSSKSKDFEAAYQEAFNGAFASVKALNYNYNGKDNIAVAQQKSITVVEEKMPITQPNSNTIKAEAIASGYLLIDQSQSKILLKLQKTSDPKVYIASNQSQHGVLINKNNAWFFEYYTNDSLISEEIDVKL